MPFTNNGKNEMLNASTVAFVSAHTAAPGETGAFEVVGGSYARQSITFAAAAAGARDSSNVPAIPIPAGTTVTHVGYWSAVTGGTFLAYNAITSDTFNNAGTLTLSDVDLQITG